jgi:hypothetical protein
VAFETEWGDLRTDGAPVLAAAPPLHEPFGLEPIDELRDVGPDTMKLTGQAAERHRLPRADELLHRVELRHREADRYERRLEPTLELLGRSEHGNEGPLIGAGSDGAAGSGVGERVVHVLKYMLVRYCKQLPRQYLVRRTQQVTSTGGGSRTSVGHW